MILKKEINRSPTVHKLLRWEIRPTAGSIPYIQVLSQALYLRAWMPVLLTSWLALAVTSPHAYITSLSKSLLKCHLIVFLEHPVLNNTSYSASFLFTYLSSPDIISILMNFLMGCLCPWMEVTSGQELFCTLLHPQELDECRQPVRCLMSVCWVDERMKNTRESCNLGTARGPRGFPLWPLV